MKKISKREQLILAYGGLRGAVGFSLVYILKDDKYKDIFLTPTLIVIFFTVFLQGGTIKLLADKLQIKYVATAILALYWVGHQVADLDWVDLDLCVPPSCLLAQPFLPNSHQPSQNWADRGRLKIQVYPTQVRDQVGHHVYKNCLFVLFQEKGDR